MNFFGKMRVSDNTTADVEKISEFLERGIENVFPSRESLKNAMAKGKRLTFYLGIDPTGPSLHMGHAIPLMKLGKLQELGHKVILLMGDFTAMIGDPTDKTATRRQLSRKEVMDNLKSYKKQASVFLKFSGPNAAEFKFNSSWLAKLDFAGVLELASKMTVDQMLKRDMFRKRAEEGKPTFIHEFLYPLMQGYDSVAMDVDGEIGGNDQTFNMLAGRDLMKAMKNKEKFVIATRLLTDPAGKKMGKTEGNMINLSDSAENMFGKVMSWTDGMIIPGFEMCTRLSEEGILKEKSFLDGGGNPRDAKLRLGEAIVAIYHGEKAAAEAKSSFLATFSDRGIPDDAELENCEKSWLVSDVLISKGIVSSKTEFRRLIMGGSVRDLMNDVTLDNPLQATDRDMDLRVGKHRFIKIRVKER